MYIYIYYDIFRYIAAFLQLMDCRWSFGIHFWSGNPA